MELHKHMPRYKHTQNPRNNLVRQTGQGDDRMMVNKSDLLRLKNQLVLLNYFRIHNRYNF